MNEKKIAIVGAGLSGLCAARELLRTGHSDFTIYEASDRPGGRVKTIEHQGYRLDLGFQVCLSAYPAFRHIIPRDTLAPKHFGCGALVEEADGYLNCLAHPLKHPKLIGNALDSSLTWEDRFHLVELTADCLVKTDAQLLTEIGYSSYEYLTGFGFSEDIIDRFFRPFFGGVFLDSDLDTDASLLRYYLKMFAKGGAFVPAGGIENLPRQLAKDIPKEKFHFGHTVESLDTLDADHIILATDPTTTAQLLGGTPPAMRHTRVLYFTSDQPVYDGKWIVLPSAGRSQVIQHFVQSTNVDPSLAPDGKHLLSATVLNAGDHDEEALFTAARADISRLYPEAEKQLTALKQITIPQALPKQIAGWRDSLPPPPEHITIVGDLTGNASLQHAMASGTSAARSISSKN